MSNGNQLKELSMGKSGKKLSNKLNKPILDCPQNIYP
jgi:hypothetical protein